MANALLTLLTAALAGKTKLISSHPRNRNCARLLLFLLLLMPRKR